MSHFFFENWYHMYVLVHFQTLSSTSQLKAKPSTPPPLPTPLSFCQEPGGGDTWYKRPYGDVLPTGVAKSAS